MRAIEKPPERKRTQKTKFKNKKRINKVCHRIISIYIQDVVALPTTKMVLQLSYRRRAFL